jgi:hypothetical protein
MTWAALRWVALLVFTLSHAAAIGAEAGAEPDESSFEHLLGEICAAWDQRASEIMGALARQRDGNLPQLGDAMFRMQRARRNCQHLRLNFACQDYQSIIAGSPRLIGSRFEVSFACALDPAGL